MNKWGEVAWGFPIGVLAGAIFLFVAATANMGKLAWKSDVAAGKTIATPTCYAQYSAVRRFPK